MFLIINSSQFQLLKLSGDLTKYKEVKRIRSVKSLRIKKRSSSVKFVKNKRILYLFRNEGISIVTKEIRTNTFN